ncbi:hypothetical protein [Vibrio sp. LaRot3]|uniref:hypothetical protein n=1 Tax=Vibrio sp. LaRot3 TaxID=2998829 RepID=UPI0022CE19CC|nr:hypothetical protein [Vibrio sp. LaRot3]MDA0148865.1 hypothetical protein [Vibrio sp. LaRot3]
MHPLQNGTQTVERPTPKNPLGDPGFFTESGKNGQPSIPGADYFNAQILEFQNLLAEGGVEFDQAKFDHLIVAIRAVCKGISQFTEYDPKRVYMTGEVCYTKTANEIIYWQWYSNKEWLAGKDPLDIDNRHLGWQHSDKPFYWVPYVSNIEGMPFFWLDTSAPEFAVMEINVDLPIAVYWRLARRYPHLVEGDFINTGEIRGEFLRVLDQGRSADPGRTINSWQNSTAFMGDGDGQNGPIPNMNNSQHLRVLGFEFDAPSDQKEVITLRYGSTVSEVNTSGMTGPGQGSKTADFARSRVRNIARPMAIII